ncbi:MAG: hypothetical protein Q4Q62_03245 [Thermoplasmata archaeon]|nr:hypothetical protein [Thermoplasmata archaeon]
MRYGLTVCRLCGRPRIADRSQASSSCPYCGRTDRTVDMGFFFESDDQAAVREALAQATGADGCRPDPAEELARKRRIEEADPMSTLVHQYERTGDIEERMMILSEGLTRIKGEFTLEDAEEVAGPRAEKMLSAMLARGFVYETRPGFYRA